MLKAVPDLFGIAFGFFYGHGAMVAYGSPKPLIWVRILVPVQGLMSQLMMSWIANGNTLLSDLISTLDH